MLTRWDLDQKAKYARAAAIAVAVWNSSGGLKDRSVKYSDIFSLFEEDEKRVQAIDKEKQRVENLEMYRLANERGDIPDEIYEQLMEQLSGEQSDS